MPETFGLEELLEPPLDELEEPLELLLLAELEDFPDDEDFAELLLLAELEDFPDDEDFSELLLASSALQPFLRPSLLLQ